MGEGSTFGVTAAQLGFFSQCFSSDWKMTGSSLLETALGTILGLYLISLIPLVCSPHLQHPSRVRVAVMVLLALLRDRGQPQTPQSHSLP